MALPAQVRLITRQLEDSRSSGQGEHGSPFAEQLTPPLLKHWAILVVYKDGDETIQVLYDACKEGDFLVACATLVTKKKLEEIKQQYTFNHHCTNQGFEIDPEKAEAFVTSFNRNMTKYETTDKNCQHFAREFLALFALESHFHIPVSAKEIRQSFFASVSAAFAGSISPAVDGIVEAIAKKGLQNVANRAIQELGEELGSQALVKSGTRITQEVAENGLSSLSKGATSWWNLLQIPMEIGVKILLRSNLIGCTELEAYAGSKLASMGTAAAVGFRVGGPLGALGSTGLWLLTEVISYFISIGMEEAFGEKYTDWFGKSKTHELVKSLWKKVLNLIVNPVFDATIERMIEYIQATQKANKLQ